MARYRKVFVKIWDDEKFREFHRDSQRLFLYHLTSPRSTPFMLYVEGAGSIGDTLQMRPREVTRYMSEIENSGMAYYESNMVFVPRALSDPDNCPASMNAVSSWTRIFQELPKTNLTKGAPLVWQDVAVKDAKTNAFVSNALSLIEEVQTKWSGVRQNLLRTQEQEQEQEQEKRERRAVPAWSKEYQEFLTWMPKGTRGRTGKDDGWAAAQQHERKHGPVPWDSIRAALKWQKPFWASVRDENGKDIVPGPGPYIRKRRWTDEAPESTPAQSRYPDAHKIIDDMKKEALK